MIFSVCSVFLLLPVFDPSRLRTMLRHHLIAIAVLTAPSSWCMAADLPLVPPELVLTGPHAAQRLIVEEARDGHFTGDMSRRATFVTANPDIAKINADGVVTPVADGTATIRAEIDGRAVEKRVV